MSDDPQIETQGLLRNPNTITPEQYLAEEIDHLTRWFAEYRRRVDAEIASGTSSFYYAWYQDPQDFCAYYLRQRIATFEGRDPFRPRLIPADDGDNRQYIFDNY